MEMIAPASGRQEIKRKATLEVSAATLRGATSIHVQVVLDGGEPQGTLTIPLAPAGRLERLLLRLEIDVKAKP
jgi:hypothetical protein